MKITSEPITSIGGNTRLDSSLCGASATVKKFESQINNAHSPPLDVNKSQLSPEMLELARRVANGDLSKDEAGRAFVETVIAQNGGAKSYGLISDKINAGVGDMVANDPNFNAKIFQGLLNLAKQESK